MLHSCGAWEHWGFPIQSSRTGGGLGLAVVKPWFRGLRLPRVSGGQDERLEADDLASLSTDTLQGLADCMQALVGGFSNMDEVRYYIDWVQGLRNSMLRARFGLSRRIYSMTHMIHCMAVSGMMRKRDSLKEVVLESVKMIVKEKTVQAYYA